jgi:hypothetical protein
VAWVTPLRMGDASTQTLNLVQDLGISVLIYFVDDPGSPMHPKTSRKDN